MVRTLPQEIRFYRDAKTYEKEGLQFIGISLDQDVVEAVERYIEKTKTNFNYDSSA